MKVALAAVAGVVAVVAVALVVSYYAGILGNRVQASYQGRVVTSQVQQAVRSAPFAQETYEQFFDDCNAVVADNAKIEIARQRVAAAKAAPDDTFGTKAGKVADAEADLAGVQQAQVETAARYNAAAAEYTRGQFLDASLPTRLEAPYDTPC
jgi:hypothetical protein